MTQVSETDSIHGMKWYYLNPKGGDLYRPKMILGEHQVEVSSDTDVQIVRGRAV